MVIVWVLYFPSNGEDYLYHAGEYSDRDSCVAAAMWLRPDEEASYMCWPVRKLMQE